jgi:hypothetical protein
MNIVKFSEYIKENFEAMTWGEKLEDKRKRPEIPTIQVFESLVQMPVFGQKTLLELDGFLRTSEAKKLHGSNRKQVASDTTVERVAEGLERKSVQEIGYEVIDRCDEEQLWDLKLPSGKKLRLGIVDGHWAGGVWASVLAIYGKTDGVVDLERYSGRGHELAASRRVQKRAFSRLGKGFFGLVAGDGLYATKDDFQLHLDHGSHLLVKTDEETLTVVQDAKCLFQAQKKTKLEGVFSQRGHDPKRFKDYEVMWAEGLEWQGLTLTVAWVQEWELDAKTGLVEQTEFYVLTTATGLTGEDLRELAHLRWKIENNIFKRLNFLVGSKRLWSRKAKVMEMFLRAWMIGLTLLGAYLFKLGWNALEITWEAMKKTWSCVTRLMMRSLILTYT